MPIGTPQDYEGASDARTLEDAHNIRKDGKRHEKAMKHIKKRTKHSTHAAHTHAHEQAAVDMYHNTDGSPANAAGMTGHEQAEPIENEHVGD